MHATLTCTSLLDPWQPVLVQQALLAAVLLIQVWPLFLAQHSVEHQALGQDSTAQRSTLELRYGVT